MSPVRLYIAIAGLLLAGVASAAPRYKSSTVTHWLGLSLTGVEATAFPCGEQVELRAGGGGSVHLLYELHSGNLFFNAGIGADYVQTNTFLASYDDVFARVDFQNEALQYRYVYSDIQERQSQLRVIIPLQIGYRFGDWVYAGVGASLRIVPLLNDMYSASRMYTQGEYDRFIEPIRNAPDYGYYPESDYNGTGVVRSAMTEVAVEAEVGVNIPLDMQKLQMRAGVFVGYDLPLSSPLDSEGTDITLVDYSAVNKSALTQTQENLKENIRFNSMLDTSLSPIDAQRLRVGLRVTLLFDITPKPKHCMCWKI